ncbi:MAG: hypothetical protein ABIO94_07830 [Opitutaceae bacterium]
MSDLSSNDTPRPVSLFTVFAIFFLFAAFLLVLKYFYLPRHTGSYSGDGIRTAQQREDILAELRKKQTEQATKYGWVDQKAGVVRLPIERAMELTVQQYGAKK